MFGMYFNQSFRNNKEIRTRFQPESSSDLSYEVEHSGFEPLTPTLSGGYLAVFKV